MEQYHFKLPVEVTTLTYSSKPICNWEMKIRGIRNSLKYWIRDKISNRYSLIMASIIGPGMLERSHALEASLTRSIMTRQKLLSTTSENIPFISEQLRDFIIRDIGRKFMNGKFYHESDISNY
jgi:hypothetical protein